MHSNSFLDISSLVLDDFSFYLQFYHFHFSPRRSLNWSLEHWLNIKEGWFMLCNVNIVSVSRRFQRRFWIYIIILSLSFIKSKTGLALTIKKESFSKVFFNLNFTIPFVFPGPAVRWLEYYQYGVVHRTIISSSSSKRRCILNLVSFGK